jgi:hypothetical protein
MKEANCSCASICHTPWTDQDAFPSSLPHGGLWSVSLSIRFTSRQQVQDTHSIGGWVGHRAGVDIVQKGKFLSPSENRTKMYWSPATSLLFVLILVEEFGMRKICAKMVPMNLTQQQRDAPLRAVFDIQMHYGEAAVSLLTWSRTLRLLFISKS